MPHTYSSYLKIDELLNLQECKSTGPEHDEMLFILIHQVYELWFKEILHELDYLTRMLRKNELTRAQHTLNRVLKIFKPLVSQLDILETMTPAEFLSFCKFLESASGFQSAQFRELEFMLGHKLPKMLDYHEQGSSARICLEQRLAAPKFMGRISILPVKKQNLRSFRNMIRFNGIGFKGLFLREISPPKAARKFVYTFSVITVELMKTQIFLIGSWLAQHYRLQHRQYPTFLTCL